MSVEIKSFPSTDPRLDWVSRHDSRSMNFLMAESLFNAEIEKKPKRWKPGVTLNQGQEGACVGFGWTQELLTSPRPYLTDAATGNSYARGFYHETLLNDEFEGEEDTGTSVLAGAKTAVRRGEMGEYRWCRTVEELRDTIITTGPVVIGIPWYHDMYWTRDSGLVTVGGDLVGGHCILVDEYHPGKRLLGEDYHARFEGFGWHNSWGDGYGINGRGFIRIEDMRDLIKQWGEMCVPVNRRRVKL